MPRHHCATKSTSSHSTSCLMNSKVTYDITEGRSSGGKKTVVVCALAVFVPWIWVIWALPVWATAAAFVLSVVSVVLISRQFAAQPSAPVVPLAPPQQPLQAQEPAQVDIDITDNSAPAVPVPVPASQQNVVALQSLVTQWLDASRQAGERISTASRDLHDVTQQSESAAVNIGNSFRSIMEKTGRQMDSAVRLLKSDTPADGGGSSWLSLPDFIKAYEHQLDEVTKRMMDFSQA